MSGGADYAALEIRSLNGAEFNGLIARIELKSKDFSNLSILGGDIYVAPAILFMMVAILFPFGVACVGSIGSSGQSITFTHPTILGYLEVLSPQRLIEYQTIFFRALIVATTSIFLGLPAAYWLVRLRNSAVRTLLLTLLLLPFVINDALRAFGWQQLLAPDGCIANVWQYLSHDHLGMSLRYNFWSPILAMIGVLCPFAIFSIVAVLPGSESEIWRAALELGNQSDAMITCIAIPLAVPGIVLGWSVIVVLALASGTEVRYLGGPMQTSSQTVLASLMDVGVNAGLAFLVLQTLLMSALLLCAIFFYRWWRHSVPGTYSPLRSAFNFAPGEQPKSQHGWKRFGAISLHHLSAMISKLFTVVGGFAVAGLVSFALISIVNVLALSLRQSSSRGSRWTLDNFASAYNSTVLWDAVQSSIGVAVVVGLLAAWLSMTLGFVWWRPKLRVLVFLVAGLGMIMAPDAYAISLQQMLRLFGFCRGGLIPVTIADIVWGFPVGLLFISLSYRQTRTQMIRAAFELGGDVGRVRSLILSTNWVAIANSATIGFLFSLNDYTRAAYLAGGSRTLSTEVYGRLESGLIGGDNSIYALAAGITFFTVIAVLVVALAFRHARHIGWRTPGVEYDL